MLNPPPSDDIDTNSFAYKQWFYMLWTSVSTTVVSAANSFIQLGIGAVTRTMQDKAREIVSVKDFGAVGNGVADDTAAFNRAATASVAVRIPAGTYLISGTITISQSNSYWSGDGAHNTIIISNSTTLPMFTFGALTGCTLINFKLTRSVVAAVGADGIKTVSNAVSQFQLKRLLIEKQYNGLNLGTTDFSDLIDIIVQKCILDGISLTNTGSDGAVQWSMENVLCQMNGGRGILVFSTPGAPQITLGTWQKIATFGNSGFGIAISGLVGCPIQGVRIYTAFIGSDGNSELYLDTYGDQHIMSNLFLELAGRNTTGPTLTTAASGIGSGLEITSNNGGILLSNCHANGNSYDGFYLNGSSHSLGNCRATNNGQQVVAGRRNGINSTSGYTVLNGGRYGNTGAGASQQYAAFSADGNNLSIGFADLSNNSVAAFSATANVNYITSVGNLPNTLNVGLSPAGAVLVGGGATSGFVAAGTINVAGGVLKNNVAYINP